MTEQYTWEPVTNGTFGVGDTWPTVITIEDDVVEVSNQGFRLPDDLRLCKRKSAKLNAPELTPHAVEYWMGLQHTAQEQAQRIAALTAELERLRAMDLYRRVALIDGESVEDVNVVGVHPVRWHELVGYRDEPTHAFKPIEWEVKNE